MNRHVPRPCAGPQVRTGAAAVEFAMTAPILFTLVLGAIEFSRSNMLLHTTAIAATEAARASIIPGATAAEVKAAGVRELKAVGITDVKIELDPPEIVDDTAQVTVNITVPVNMKNGYILPRIFLGKEVFKSVTLQREGKNSEVSDETPMREGVKKTGDKSEKAKTDNSGPGNANDG
jgi:hypothetical protein